MMSRRRALVCGLAAALLWLALGLYAIPRCGVHIDEASYLITDYERQPWFAGGEYDAAGRWQPLDRWSRPAMQAAWGFSPFNCHPALLRILTGTALWLWPDGPAPLVARLPNLLAVALALGAVTATAGRLWGGAAALTAAAGLLASPRIARYALLATHDPLLLATAALATLAVWRLISRRRLPLAILALALMFASKINAIPVAVGLLLWALLTGRGRLTLAALGAALLCYLVAEPQFWHDRFGQMRAMADFHLQHVSYPLQLFGLYRSDGRWQTLYPLVQLAAALPLAQLLAALVGAAAWRRARGPARELLLLAAALLAVNLGLAAAPGSPKYAGVRLFLYVMPWVFILAAFGAAQIWRAVRGWPARGLLLAALLFPLLAGARLGGHASLYASELVGGSDGWAALGNETEQEFMHLTPALLAEARARLGAGARLVITPACPLVRQLHERWGTVPAGVIVEDMPRPGDGVLVGLGLTRDPGAARALAGRMPLKLYAVDAIPLYLLYRW